MFRYAINSDGQKVEATETGQRAFCPDCGEEMMSRCGDVYASHWAHMSKDRENCNLNRQYKPMTKWHRDWQDRFDNALKEELVVDEEGNRFYADVKNSNGIIIEFQHSTIPAEVVMKREKVYKDLIWVLDIETFPITETAQNTEEYRTVNNVEPSQVIDNLTAAEIEWIIETRYKEETFKSICSWTKYLNENNKRFYLENGLSIGHLTRKTDRFKKHIFIDDRQGNLWYKYKNHPIITYFEKCQPKLTMNKHISIDEWHKQTPSNYVLEGVQVKEAQPYNGLIKSISYEDFIKKYNV